MGTPVSDLHKEWLADPAYAAEHEALKPEFALARQLIAARSKAGLTQAQVAERMGTKQGEISRIEGGKQNVSVGKLRKYADAVGASLEIRFG